MTLLGRRIAILAGAAVFFIGLIAVLVTGKKAPPPVVPAPPPVEAGPPAPTIAEITIQKGQTISDILSGYRFTAEEIHRLIQQVKPIFKLDKISR